MLAEKMGLVDTPEGLSVCLCERICVCVSVCAFINVCVLYVRMCVFVYVVCM